MVGLELTGTCGGCVWGVLGDTGACTCRVGSGVILGDTGP